MGMRRNILSHIMEQPIISPEAVPGQPIIEVAGETRVLIENHQGVCAYGKEQILVKVKYGTVCVCGCNLEMMHMTKEQLVIHGKIHSVELQRRR